jgi:hypothetical protein
MTDKKIETPVDSSEYVELLKKKITLIEQARSASEEIISKQKELITFLKSQLSTVTFDLFQTREEIEKLKKEKL